MEAVFQYGRAHTLNLNMRFNLLILGILLLTKLSICCLMLENQYGNVSDDQDIEIGKGFSYHCNLNSDTIEKYNVTAKDLTLALGKQSLTDHVTILNDTTIEFSKNVSYLNDSGFYQCHVPIPGYNKSQLVCASMVNIGTEPKEVSNFSCFGYGLKILNCSWINPANDVPTRYVLYDYLNNDPNYSRRCPDRQINSCVFRLDTKPPYIRGLKTLNFILNGTNSLGTIEQYFSLRHFEIVKPNPPSKVSTRNVTKNSIVLDILAPSGLKYGEYPYGLVYEVEYHAVLPVYGENKVISVVAEINAEYKVTDLVPNTLYKFIIRCRLNNTGENYYLSDEKIVTEVTKPDVPYLAPKVDPSGFDSTVLENNVTVNLYWEAVPLEFENGNDFRYLIKYHQTYVPPRHRRDVNNEIDVGNRTSYTINNLSKDSAYIFTIIAANEEGQSLNESSSIVVDKQLLHGPKDIQVVYSNYGNFRITWNSSDAQQENFTVAYCETPKARPDTCDGPIIFEKYSDNDVRLSLKPRTNYQFGVASVDKDRTSGLYWAPCYVTKGILYGVKSLYVMPKTSTSLKVTWTYPCPSAVRIVEEIEIVMCPTQNTCSEFESHPESFDECRFGGGVKLLTHTIKSGTVTETVVDGLQPFTHYLAVIRVKTDGGWGQYSNARCESTMSAAPSDVPTNVLAETGEIVKQMPTIQVTFRPPVKPNGIITRHIVRYNNTSIFGGAKEKELRVPLHDSKQPVVILEKVAFYTNYSIQVKSCVEQACSNYSEPVYVMTEISVPGIMNLPHVEISDKSVNISWEAPVLPNGPLDYYQVRKMINNSEDEVIYNVTGDQRFLVLNEPCGKEKTDTSQMYEISVRAINVKDNISLPGVFSRPLHSKLCTEGNDTWFYVGCVFGALFGIGAFAISSYWCITCVYSQAKKAKLTKIQLPRGMDIENPLTTYDKIKGGLQNNHDSNHIPYERGYERFFTSANSNEGKNSEDENVPITSRANGRNLSGESDLSSAHTTKTHNSIDSGAEVESPPSPDSYPSDSSAHTTPRGNKAALDVVNEGKPCCSTDSGLENQSCEGAGLNLASWIASPCVYIPRGDKTLVDARSLSNSEPSVADLDVGEGTDLSNSTSVLRSWSCSGLYSALHPFLPSNGKYGADPLKSTTAPGIANHQVMSVGLPDCIWKEAGGSPRRDPYSLVGIEANPYIIPVGDVRRQLPPQVVDTPPVWVPCPELEIASQKDLDETLMLGGACSRDKMAGGCVVFEAPQQSSPDTDATESMLAGLNHFMNTKFLVDVGGFDNNNKSAGEEDSYPMRVLSPANLSVPNEDPQVAVVPNANDTAQDVSTLEA